MRKDARTALLLVLGTLLLLPAAASADRAWLAPERVTSAGMISNGHGLGVADDGTVVIAWTERSAEGYRNTNPVYAAIRVPGEATIRPTEIGRHSQGGVEVASNGRGDVAVTWQDDGIWVARRRAGAAAFDAAEKLEETGWRTGSRVPVAINEAGDVLVVHTGGLDDGPVVGAWFAPVGEPFGRPRELHDAALMRNGGIYDVALSSSREATGVAVNNQWDRDAEGKVSALTWQADGDAPVRSEVLAEMGSRAARVAEVETTAAGDTVALWASQAPSGYGAVVVRHRARGAGFGPALPLAAPEGADVLRRPLQLTAAGALLTAWSPDYYAQAGTLVSGAFGLPPLVAQPVLGHPYAIAPGGGAEGDLVVLGHAAGTNYGARLVTGRRSPLGVFTGFEDAVASCTILSAYHEAATGADGTGAILTLDPKQELWLLVDAPTTAPPARACHPPAAYGIEPPKVELPPVALPDPPIELPKPPVDLPKPKLPAPPLDVKVESVRPGATPGEQVVTLSVRCTTCVARASGKLVAQRKVLSRAKHTARARRGRARVKLRFKVRRTARAAARTPRRYAIALEISVPGAAVARRTISVTG